MDTLTPNAPAATPLVVSSAPNGTPDGAVTPPAPAVSGSFRDFLGDGDTFKPGWAKALGGPDALEAKFTSPKSLVGSYAALEKLISAKGIIPPGPNATPEQKSEFYKALGRPDKPEDYGIKMPEKIGDKPFPKELWNAEQAGQFAKWAHEKGFNKEQVNALIEFDAARGMGAHESFTQQSAKAQADAASALKTEWGANYDANLAAAKEAAKAVGGEELLNHALANDPAFIKAMAKVGAMTQERPAAGARGTQAGTTDPKAEIAAIHADKNHPWHPQNTNKAPIAHQRAVEHMTKLYKMVHGET